MPHWACYMACYIACSWRGGGGEILKEGVDRHRILVFGRPSNAFGEACRNKELSMRMPHVGPWPVTDFSSHLLRDGGRGKRRRRGGSGKRTGNPPDRCPTNALRMARRHHWSPPLVAISKAHARKQEAKLALWLMSARVGHSIAARWL